METQADKDAVVLRWVEELRRGENVEANSRRIFKVYYGWVRGFFTRRRFPFERAEELAQEAFLQAFQRIDTFRGQGSFDSWIFAISANLLRNERRRLAQQKRDATEVPIEMTDPQGGSPVEMADDAASPEKAAFDRQRLRALEQALAKLPKNPRDCIRLRLAGYEYPEIAALLKLAPSTARVHVFTARQRLQEELGDDLGGWFE